MSSLAFDKQGRPFKLDPRTRFLRACEFNNPGARGTCANVYDDDGELLHVEADCTYLEFAKLVGDGFFRLVQCDENRAELDAPPAYVNVRPKTRNQFGATNSDALDPRDAVIVHLTQSNQELARTNAEIAKAALAQHAAVMMASANLMREYTAAPPPPRISVIEAPHSDDYDERDDRDEDEHEQADDHAPAAVPVPGWMPIYQEVKPHLPAIGGFLYARIMEVLHGKTASPAAAPTPAAGSNADAASTAPSNGSAPNGAAAGPSAPSASTANTSESNASAPGASAPTSSASSGTAPAATPNAATSTEKAHGTTPTAAVEPAATAPDGPRNAPTVSPTPEQMMRLLEIRSKLTPTEIAIAEHAIKRMSSNVLAQWLADLTARPVDDAVGTVRSMIAQAREQQVRG